jgi:adenylate cyclase
VNHATRIPARLRKALAGMGIALASTLVAIVLVRVPLIGTIEWKIYDLEFRTLTDPAKASRDIVMVKIDDESIERMDKAFDLGRFPWSRDTYAVLLDYLARAHPRAVSFDLVLTERDRSQQGAEYDQQLVDATRRLGNVIHAIEVNDTYEEQPASPSTAPYRLTSEVEEHRCVRLPFDTLAKAARLSGTTFTVLDSDGPIRRSVPFVRQGDSYYPSLGIATAMVALGLTPSDIFLDAEALHVGAARIPLLPVTPEYVRPIKTRHMLVRYPAPPFADRRRLVSSYRSFPFCDLFLSELQLREGKKPEVDPESFRDKIVFIGTTAAGLHDLMTTPFGAQGKMPGMQIHAAVVDNILNQSFLKRATPLAWGLLLAAATLLSGMLGVYLGFWRALLVSAGIAVGIAGTASWSFTHGTWLPVAPAFLGLGIAQFSSVAYRYFVEDRARRQVKNLFSRYVSPAVVKELIEDPSKARLGGQRRDMTVLFSDIRGFTTFSESGQPENVILQLNEYLSRMVHLLFKHHGTLDKFVGDMIMALFNAPIPDPDHADHAVQMALAMFRELDVLNRRWREEGKSGFDIGVGINTGDMIVGNVGSERTLSYTVIGDNVNLGSRLESLNKEYHSHIIISDATRRQLKGSYPIRPLGIVKVKGKSQEVSIFEVCLSQEELIAKEAEAISSTPQ